ncbi:MULTISPECIES: D-isomer specific 2-hydroxyacid dehydrogenase family protein [Gordonia]|uniref:2-hydroxyacid dehydrogenase n=2 Tax=Gordonia alkanivorans TaxID=84096 RepID=W9DLJ1_9ACTN|nr:MULTISPECIES: D-isomer specific 2-hydroxyacid dehydrogenase family protein [Gordonia]ETA08331.1 2-hydroxyacid dehydrogenase [Gordonia alkanivorans CGMCC 6845]MDH3011313.1 D-isomer specific 2-hydroxyacid dehydrogenase family protein [Gordonia alkanivorans]MDH3015747.1 D-isomer specific 2-hydroxyacid dehydrogenase family protein [Gordonia alkanivorans]MDH3020799.1 D-isomer specific 2-hydroxyacid dehydrogenase family protein [Gordonia alkanivorans]MDH3040749.1 D-isomer specific 2-hydroxyacid d
MSSLPVAVEPNRDEHLVAAVEGAGGTIVGLDEARVLVWIGPPAEFPELPDAVEWVALKTAGIEDFLDAGLLDNRRVWTNAAGFYAENVAEHALALLLAGLRQINTAVTRHWDKERIDTSVRSLHGSTVAIIGAGGIGASLGPRLKACGARVVAVNRSGRDVPGADEVRRSSELDSVWSSVDHVVLAAPSTAKTRHMINAETLAALPSHAWVVSIARGPLVDEEALYRALVDGEIAGAALDVTDPEPPAEDHPLWSLPNVIITPHVANPASGLTREMAPWLAENVRRFAAGEELISVVTPGRDY